MAMGDPGTTTTAAIDDAITTYVAELRMTMEHEGIMAPLIDTQTLPKKVGRTYTEPYVGALTARALTGGVEFNSPSIINDDKIECTPGQVGVQVLWEHRMADSITFNFPEIAGKVMGNSITYNIDTTLLALLDSFAGTLGGGTKPLTRGLVSAAMSFVRPGIALSPATKRTGARDTGDPIGGPYAVVAHEFNRHDIDGQLIGTAGTSQLTGAVTGDYPMAAGATQLNARWMEEHYAGKLSGAKLAFTGNLAIASNVVKGGAFAKTSMFYLKYREMIDKKVETDDGRFTKHTIVVDYGSKIRVPTGGVELNLDATAPAA